MVVELTRVENAIKREAVAISDMFKDLKQFDAEGTRGIRRLVIEYTQAVIDNDWPALDQDRLAGRTDTVKSQLVQEVMGLNPASPLQEKLWARILADGDAMSDHRLIRLDSALAEPPVYVYVVVFGFLVTMGCFGAYRPQAPILALLSLYTVFVGLVLYLIVSLSDPFHGGLGLEPATFEHLVETLQADLG